MARYKILANIYVEGRKIKSPEDAYNQLYEWIDDWCSEELRNAIVVRQIKEDKR